MKLVKENSFFKRKEKMNKEPIVEAVKKELYKDLMPNDSIDNGEVYFSAIEWALNSKKITNIALTGPYGSGKSSVISSFLNGHQEYENKYIKISLASFVGNSKDTSAMNEKRDELQQDDSSGKSSDMTDEPNKNSAVLEKELERGILKQLFYHAAYNDIPQSRYHKLHAISEKDICLWVVCFLTIFTGVSFFAKRDSFLRFLNSVYSGITYFNSILWNIFAITLIILLAAGVIKTISVLIRNLCNRFSGIEIDLFDKARLKSNEKDESVFDRDLEEIIYFFEESGYDIVIIEDLDRFDNSEIFVKLRELNILLNNYKPFVESGRKIRFIYAILDEMFDDTERTKFFDFIIPIVPYINSTNSCELLKRRFEDLKDLGFEYDISEEFISSIAIYVNDMRLLYSVVNEFIIYKRTLSEKQNVPLDDEKMLSLMIFKNIYPAIFSDLEKEEGIVRAAFDSKKYFVAKKAKSLNAEISEIKETLESVENDVIHDEKELKLVFLHFLSNNYGIVSYVCTANGQKYHYSDIMADDFDLSIFRNNIQAIRPVDVNRGQQLQGEIPFPGKDKEKNKEMGAYILRWENIRKATGKEREKLVELIREKQEQLLELSGEKLSSLIDKYGLEDVLTAENICTNALLIFLLRNGYIDETYPNYINYFHPDSINIDENSFIINVINHGKPLDYNILLPHSEIVFRRIAEPGFRQLSILNFELVDYVFNTNNINEGKKKNLLSVLSSRELEAKRFIVAYIKRNKNVSAFISEVADANKHLWNDIFHDESVPDNTKEIFFVKIVQSISREQYAIQNEENSVTQFLLSRRNIFGGLSDINPKSMSNLINDLGLSFSDVDLSFVDDEVFNTIVDNRRYDLNQIMLSEIVKRINGKAYFDFEKANYGAVLQCRREQLILNIEENIEKYITNVYLTLDKNENDKWEDYVSLIGRLGLNNELSYRILDREKDAINSFESLVQYCDEDNTDELESFICYCMKNERCTFNYYNVKFVYDNFGFFDGLIEYLALNIKKIKTWKKIAEFDENLMNSILNENSFEEEVYLGFLDVFEEAKDKTSIDIDKISDEHLENLIKRLYITFTVDNYASINSHNKELLTKYLEVYASEYITEMSRFPNIDDVVAEKLLNCGCFSTEEKEAILQKLPIDNISNSIAKVVRDKHIHVNKDYFAQIWEKLTPDDRYELLLTNIDIFKNSELPYYFERLDSPEFRMLADRSYRHKVSLFRNKYNEDLLRKLSAMKYVGKVEYETITNKKKFLLFESEEHEDRVFAYVISTKRN